MRRVADELVGMITGCDPYDGSLTVVFEGFYPDSDLTGERIVINVDQDESLQICTGSDSMTSYEFHKQIMAAFEAGPLGEARRRREEWEVAWKKVQREEGLL